MMHFMSAESLQSPGSAGCLLVPVMALLCFPAEGTASQETIEIRSNNLFVLETSLIRTARASDPVC